MADINDFQFLDGLAFDFSASRSFPAVELFRGDKICYIYICRDTTVYLFLAYVWKLKLLQVLIARRWTMNTSRCATWQTARVRRRSFGRRSETISSFENYIMLQRKIDRPRSRNLLESQFYFDTLMVHVHFDTFSTLFKFIWDITSESIVIFYRIFT